MLVVGCHYHDFCTFNELKRPLSILWQASLKHGQIPSDLLLVLVSPVHKGGSRGVPKNYRPVALTSHLIKVFERVLRKFLVNYLEQHYLLQVNMKFNSYKFECIRY